MILIEQERLGIYLANIEILLIKYEIASRFSARGQSEILFVYHMMSITVYTLANWSETNSVKKRHDIIKVDTES